MKKITFSIVLLIVIISNNLVNAQYYFFDTLAVGKYDMGKVGLLMNSLKVISKVVMDLMRLINGWKK